MKNLIIIITGLVLLFAPEKINAQEYWSLELRSGASIATQNLGDADLATGFGIEGTVAYRFMPHLSAFAGWGWNKFSADNSFAGPENDFEETGYTFGFQFVHPIGESGISYLLKLGGIYSHIEVENVEGEIISDSGHGFGWEAGIGIVVTLNNRLSLIPSFDYRALSRDIEIDDKITSVDQNYVSVGVGLSWSF